MALKLFTDTQKASLAKEAGVTWKPSPDSFSRDYNPNTGEATMYFKMGENQKFYGKKPNTVNTTDPVISSALRMKDETQAQRLYDNYNISQSTIPTSRAMIQNDVNVKYNYQDQFEQITQQRASLYKSMVGNQSKVFSAVNPDGTPVDPRIKVAQYQANLKGIGDRLSQLDNLEQIYRSEAKILGDAEYDRQIQANEKAKTALLYMKQIADIEQQAKDNTYRDKQLERQNSQFNANLLQNQSQFNETKALQYAQMKKPDLIQNAQWEWDWVTPPSSWNWARTDRHANPTAFTTDIAKQAWLEEGVDYEIGDAFGANGQYHTAKILWDPIATTIKVIDKIGFKTQKGASRWTYTDKLGLNDETWAKMDTTQKTEAIKKMYKQEGWSGSLFGENKWSVTPTWVQGKMPSKEVKKTDEEKLQSEVDNYLWDLRVKLATHDITDADEAHNLAYQKYAKEMAKFGYTDAQIKNYLYNALK